MRCWGFAAQIRGLGAEGGTLTAARCARGRTGSLVCQHPLVRTALAWGMLALRTQAAFRDTSATVLPMLLSIRALRMQAAAHPACPIPQVDIFHKVFPHRVPIRLSMRELLHLATLRCFLHLARFVVTFGTLNGSPARCSRSSTAW